VSDDGNDQDEALRRLELALASGAQALTARMCRPQNRTSEEWALAFAGNLTELIRAASCYLDTETADVAVRATTAPQRPSCAAARPVVSVPHPRQTGHRAAVPVSS
jgi:hypothetical protein